MATTSPGWYDDGRGALRWWDGAQWSEHVQTPDAEPLESAGATAAGMSAESSAGSADLPASPGSAASSAAGPTPFELAPDSGDAPTVPPGYPGGFEGGATPSGAFISATEPKKSKAWIVWVVIGVVLLGLVVLATVLIPIAIGMFGSAAGGGSQDEDQAAAVAAVEQYDEAWATGDCEKFEQATTEGFRQVLEIPDCASFTAASQGFVDSVEDYQLTVTSVQNDTDEQITVITSETYTSMVDADGNPTDVAQPYEDNYAYIVIPDDDGWVIDQALDAGQE